MRYTIPLSKPYLTDSDISGISKCVQSSWISSKSPWIDLFEKMYAKKVSRTKYAASVNSGTSALFLALKALNIGPGDEVILPTFTMIATINAIVWAGATPVLVDSTSVNDWNMNVEQIEVKITKRTKAIMPVHIYGYMCDMNAIIELAQKHKLTIIEDAAEAMGSEYHGKRAGSLSILSCFSLYANKIITTGNGGMVCTNDERLYKLIKKLSFFDFNEKTHFKHLLFGYNLVLSGLQGALGCSQVKNFDLLVNKRRQIYKWYQKYIHSDAVHLMNSPRNQNPNYWFPAILFKTKKSKKEAISLFEKHKVESRDFFISAHQQPIYKGLFDKKAFPIADYFTTFGLLLPSFHELKEKEAISISQILNSIKA
jgi:perosamine synthetase